MRSHVLCGLALLAVAPLIGCRGENEAARADRRLARAMDADQLATKINSEKLELVAGVEGPMPTGVAVSREGRIFINYPRWGDDVQFTVAELKDGKPVAYPSAGISKFDEGGDPVKQLVSVQSVVIDAQDRLWILDTGSINFGPVIEGAAKLVCVDLGRNEVVKTIAFPPDVALKTTYLNDVRFDLERGAAGFGFITDSSGSGPNGIIVVDLETGESWRRLNDHPSTKAEKNLAPVVEGQPLKMRMPGQAEEYLTIGADGIAISSDRQTLYYCPLISRRLYSVSVDALADRNRSDDDVASTVKDLGDRGYASDGLEGGADGRIYLTDYEHNAIRVREANGKQYVLVSDPRIIWPDSLSLQADGGMLYFTANQLNRQARFHNGRDLRKQPYAIFRIPTGVGTRMETASSR